MAGRSGGGVAERLLLLGLSAAAAGVTILLVSLLTAAAACMSRSEPPLLVRMGLLPGPDDSRSRSRSRRPGTLAAAVTVPPLLPRSLPAPVGSLLPASLLLFCAASEAFMPTALGLELVAAAAGAALAAGLLLAAPSRPSAARAAARSSGVLMEGVGAAAAAADLRGAAEPEVLVRPPAAARGVVSCSRQATPQAAGWAGRHAIYMWQCAAGRRAQALACSMRQGKATAMHTCISAGNGATPTGPAAPHNQRCTLRCLTAGQGQGAVHRCTHSRPQHTTPPHHTTPHHTMPGAAHIIQRGRQLGDVIILSSLARRPAGLGSLKQLLVLTGATCCRCAAAAASAA
jgi:hypothetical protein